MIPAGKRNKYLAVEYDAGTTQNSDGHVTPNWTKRFNVWGAIESRVTASKEAWSVFRVYSTCSHVVTIPYTTQAITSEDRITFDGRRFNIAGPPVDIDQRNFQIVIPVVEGPST